MRNFWKLALTEVGEIKMRAGKGLTQKAFLKTKFLRELNTPVNISLKKTTVAD